MSSDRREQPGSTERLDQQRQLEQQQPVAAKSGEFGEFSLPLGSDSGASGKGMLAANKSTPMEMLAIRRKWNIRPSVFETLADRMEQIANSESRQAVAAAKVLLDMHQQNSVDETVGSGGGDVVIFLPDNGRGQ